MSETDNKLCPMCNIILELLKQKEYLLSETLAKHKNITLYEHMRESTSLEEQFFKRINMNSSIEEWKPQLEKIWWTKVNLFVEKDKRSHK